jgi:hypothetical protein
MHQYIGYLNGIHDLMATLTMMFKKTQSPSNKQIQDYFAERFQHLFQA